MRKVNFFSILCLFAFMTLNSTAQNSALKFADNGFGGFHNTVTVYGINVNGATSLSVEAWCNLNSYQPYATILIKENQPPCHLQNVAFNLFISPIGHVMFGIGNGSDFPVDSSSTVIPLHEWHHIAATWDGTTSRIYIDGILDASASAVGPLTDQNQGMDIGNRWNCTRRWLDGTLDELMIWSDVRTQAEISANMNNVLSNPAAEPNLIAYFQFDEGNGTTTQDSGPNGLTGQLGGVQYDAGETSAPAWVDSGVSFGGCSTVDLGDDKTVFYGYDPMECTTLTANVSEGTPPYTYLWSNGATTASTQVCPGTTTTYSVAVTDAGNCTTTGDVTVDVVDVRCGWFNHGVLVCHQSFFFPNWHYTVCVSKWLVPFMLYFGDELGSCNLYYKSTPVISEIPEFSSQEELEAYDRMLFEKYNANGNEPLTTQLNVYPNPVKSFASVEFTTKASDYTTIEVYNLLGEKITTLFAGATESGKQYNATFDGSSLNSGTYLIIMKQGGDVKMEKISVK